MTRQLEDLRQSASDKSVQCFSNSQVYRIRDVTTNSSRLALGVGYGLARVPLKGQQERRELKWNGRLLIARASSISLERFLPCHDL